MHNSQYKRKTTNCIDTYLGILFVIQFKLFIINNETQESDFPSESKRY